MSDQSPQEYDVDLLRAFVARGGVSCPSCGYDLRGIAGPLCPECGIKLELILVADRRDSTAFLAGLMGLSGMLGFSWLLTLWAVIMGTRWNAVDAQLYLVLGGTMLASIAFIVGWFRLRSWLARQRPAMRRALVGLCWLLQLFSLLLALLAFGY